MMVLKRRGSAATVGRSWWWVVGMGAMVVMVMK